MLLWRTLGWKLVKQPLSRRAKGYNNERNKLCSSKNAEDTLGVELATTNNVKCQDPYDYRKLPFKTNVQSKESLFEVLR